jgi:predicted nucleotidyltransferase
VTAETKTGLSDTDREAMVRAILAVSEPAAIILFGSHARGDAHESSDVDLLVVRKDEFRPGDSRRKELTSLYRSIAAVSDAPKDIILFTKNEFLCWRNTTNHMASMAWKEGRLLYGEV